MRLMPHVNVHVSHGMAASVSSTRSKIYFIIIMELLIPYWPLRYLEERKNVSIHTYILSHTNKVYKHR